MLGPGLISGAADDDPVAIATYSQAGAKFGYGLCWLPLLCYPIMAVVQEVRVALPPLFRRMEPEGSDPPPEPKVVKPRKLRLSPRGRSATPAAKNGFIQSDQ